MNDLQFLKYLGFLRCSVPKSVRHIGVISTANLDVLTFSFARATLLSIDFSHLCQS